MNCLRRMMLMKGMGKRCPIRLSLVGACAAVLLSAVVSAVWLLIVPPTAKEQELRLAALEAKKDRDELLAVLEGRRAWITVDGQQYARVEWITARERVE